MRSCTTISAPLVKAPHLDEHAGVAIHLLRSDLHDLAVVQDQARGGEAVPDGAQSLVEVGRCIPITRGTRLDVPGVAPGAVVRGRTAEPEDDAQADGPGNLVPFAASMASFAIACRQGARSFDISTMTPLPTWRFDPCAAGLGRRTGWRCRRSRRVSVRQGQLVLLPAALLASV
jgi:hypothetical protein